VSPLHTCRAGQNHIDTGLARTIYIRFIYGIFGREITKYTVIYGAYIYVSGQLYLCCIQLALLCHLLYDEYQTHIGMRLIVETG
jgi:hypothetical protein